MRLLPLIIAILFPSTCFSTLQTEIKQSRLGPYLYTNHINSSIQDFGYVQSLSGLHRSVLNIEQSSDMLQDDLRFFNPNLVTSGQDVAVNSLGYNPSGTCLVWRNRSFHNLRNARADFQLIPTLLISNASSVSTGSLSGFSAPGGVVRLDPVDIKSDSIVTYLYHRIGYYGFDPVEFVHQRPVGSNTHLTLAGFFPSSGGRFENAAYTGNTLYGGFSCGFDEISNISINLMQGVNRTGIPYTDIKKVLKRYDLDVAFNVQPSKKSDFTVTAYRTEEIDKYDDFRSYGYETGIKLDATNKRMWGTLTLNSTLLNLPVSNTVQVVDVNMNLGKRTRIGIAETILQIGGESRLPDHVQLTPSLSFEINSFNYGRFSVVVQRTIDRHSLELQHANYREAHPIDDLEPIWRAFPDLPLDGRNMPLTESYSAELGWRRDVLFGEVGALGFFRLDENPVFWSVEADTVITPMTLDERTTVGGNLDYSAAWKQYRGRIGVMYFDRNNEYYKQLPAAIACPAFRFNWEIGWHDTFYAGDFEADISLGGQYFDEYYSYAPEGWQLCGGAYPMDFRITARIKSFTMFWGLHNLNAYPYDLVPGYRMMHKEEYWGIHWRLYN